MKNKLKSSKWLFFYKSYGYYIGSFKKSKFKYIKSSIIALFFGFLISSLFIMFSGANPLNYFFWTFKVALDPLFISGTIIIISLYILASVSLSIGFKCKVFNIGIAGQMMLSGALILIIGIKNPNLSQPEIIFISIVVSILSGGLLSFFSAILKNLFNVNEVVTTIMSNWIIYYFLKWLFVDKGTSLGIWNANNGISTDITNPNFTLSIGNNSWILPLFLSFFALIAMGIIFYKTRFGFKTILIGENINTAKYSGVNPKFIFTIIIILQGSIAGLLGMIYYMDFSDNYINFASGSFPLFGFNAFAVSLISFNNPFGIFIVSILWGILESGALPASQLPQFHISKDIASLIFGIIIYFAAIYTLFINFNLILTIKKWYINNYQEVYKKDHNIYRKKLKLIKNNINKSKINLIKKYNLDLKELKNNCKVKKIINKENYWIETNLLKQKLNNEIQIELQKKIYLKKEYKIKYNNNFEEYLNIGIKKIKNNYNSQMKINLFRLLNDSVFLKYEYKIQLLKLNNDKKTKINIKKELNNNISELIIKFNNEKNKLKIDKKNIIINYNKNKIKQDKEI